MFRITFRSRAPCPFGLILELIMLKNTRLTLHTYTFQSSSFMPAFEFLQLNVEHFGVPCFEHPFSH
jgi:hypothetical protein